MKEATWTFSPPLGGTQRSRLEDYLLGVRAIHAYRPLRLSGTTEVTMSCQDGTHLTATTEMCSIRERLEVGSIRFGIGWGADPLPSDFVLLGHLPEPSEVGLLEIDVEGERIVSGVFFRSPAGETGVVAAALPIHLTWYGEGLRAANGPPEHDLSAYRRVTL